MPAACATAKTDARTLWQRVKREDDLEGLGLDDCVAFCRECGVDDTATEADARALLKKWRLANQHPLVGLPQTWIRVD